MKKQIPKEISKHFSKLGKQSWKKRQEKLLKKQEKKKVDETITNSGLDESPW